MTQFKKVPNLPFEVSTDGTVKQVDNSKPVKIYIDNKGYKIFAYKRKLYKIHRLVAQLFIPNHNNKPVVNHIDSNKLNNNVNNLEWVTVKENTIHSGIRPIKKEKPVVRICPLTLKIVESYKSVKKVEPLFKYRSVSNVCKGIQKTHRGFIFEYA